MRRTVFIYLFDGYSDWEIAYLTPELRKRDEVQLVYFSTDGMPVESLGGMFVGSLKTISQIDIKPTDMLLLPGGTIWEQHKDGALVALINQCKAQGSFIAAICGSTVFLANMGILDSIKHTSNALHYLKWFAPYYKGEANYVDKHVVVDNQIITATGTAPIEFAREVIKAMGLNEDTGLNSWFKFFRCDIFKNIH